MKKIQEELENLMIKDNVDELTAAIRGINKRLDAIAFYTFAYWIGLREGQGVKYTVEEKEATAGNLGLTLDKIKKMTRGSKRVAV